MKYKRGDKVWWWSEVGGLEERTKAIFVDYDGKRDAFLAIKIGEITHVFRWSLKGVAPLDDYGPPSHRAKESRPQRAKKRGRKLRRDPSR